MSANGAPYSYSNHTLEKVAKAKATLESFYANLITQHQERKNRFALFQNNINSSCSNLLVFGITFEKRYVLVAQI